MQRPNFRAPHHTMGARGFRSPPPAGLGSGSWSGSWSGSGSGSGSGGAPRFPSPPWAAPSGPYAARFGPYGGAPDTRTSPREFSGHRGGGGGKYNGSSPGPAPRRPSGPSRPRHSLYPGQHGGYQGSPRTSTPRGRDRGPSAVDQYYKASMLQDPWENLQPVSVAQTRSKCSSQQATHTGRTGRYYHKP